MLCRRSHYVLRPGACLYSNSCAGSCRRNSSFVVLLREQTYVFISVSVVAEEDAANVLSAEFKRDVEKGARFGMNRRERRRMERSERLKSNDSKRGDKGIGLLNG